MTLSTPGEQGECMSALQERSETGDGCGETKGTTQQVNGLCVISPSRPQSDLSNSFASDNGKYRKTLVGIAECFCG